MFDKSVARSIPSSTAPVKEFTEKWLQALTLSAALPAAQRIKPLISDIDSLSNYQPNEDRLTMAKHLWGYGVQEGLQPILEIAPYQHKEWRFDDEERFRFESLQPEGTEGYESWVAGLGLTKGEIPLVAVVNYDDWTNLLRKEMVRHGRALNMTAIPDGNMLRVNCTGVWDGQNWMIRFENPAWLVLNYDSRFSVERPSIAEIDERLTWAMMTANDAVQTKGTQAAPDLFRNTLWMDSVEKLRYLHVRVLEEQSAKFSHGFRRSWACVWTVIYREQNKLRGSCDINYVRSELETCFRTQPRLTVWMFVFAKLVCLMQLGNGLGVSGDYRD